MSRKTKKELNELIQKYNTDILWSWSRYKTYKEDSYEYYLKYILGTKEDRHNIYTFSGSAVHDIIERYYNNEMKQSDMLTKYEDELLMMNLAGYKYDRNDKDKNEKIANKYEGSVRHFFKHHTKPNWKMITEPFVIIEIADNIVFQGYIDNLAVDNDDEEKKIIITDYKTSTLYKGEKLNKESGQLFLYAEGIRQKSKRPLSDIVVQYNFVKYITALTQQANGKWKERYILRCEIGQSLVATARMWLKKLGYEPDDYIDDLVVCNSIDGLPSNVKDKIIIKDCYVQVQIDEQIIENLKSDIIKTVSEIRNKTTEYNKAKNEKLFWRDVVKDDEYRLAVLSGYSRKHHKPYDEYLKEQEMFVKKEKSDSLDNDLSWLDDL